MMHSASKPETEGGPTEAERLRSERDELWERVDDMIADIDTEHTVDTNLGPINITHFPLDNGHTLILREAREPDLAEDAELEIPDDSEPTFVYEVSMVGKRGSAPDWAVLVHTDDTVDVVSRDGFEREMVIDAAILALQEVT